MKIIRLLAVVLFLISCAEKGKWYNLEELEQFRDNDEINKLNNDNNIYIPERVFRYKYQYKTAAGEVRYIAAKYNSACETDKSVNCIDWKLVSSIEESSDTVYPITYIELYVYRTKGHNSLSNSQTIIKYDYYNSNGRILMGEQTGVVEDSSEVFLHPPRMFGFSLTELNPFPNIHYNKVKWQGQLSVPDKMLRKTKLDLGEFVSLDFSYEKKDSNTVKTEIGEIECVEVEGIATSKAGKSSLNALFNKKYGFVKLDYINIDSSSLIIELMEVK